MSTVFQDFNIYYLTIRENVALSNLNNKDNDKVIKSALDMATFSNKIYDEQLDLDLIIGRNFNGLELSGGERQKLAMARAFARNSKLVILDEPTASLDPESEYFILQNFKKLYDNKTLIMISHRLTNSKDMSKIIVMDNGRIIENGNHNELIANRMKYCKFYTLQAMKYNTEGL
jgi:ABC-type multidrug transport system fused ATPase/permease subunit